MLQQFSPFDLTCWLIFAGFLLSIFSIVKLFHLKHPGYPEFTGEREKLARVAPMKTLEVAIVDGADGDILKEARA